MTPTAQRRSGQCQNVRSYSGFDRQPIAGEWRHGRGGRVNRDHDPFSGAVLVEIPEANREDMGATYAFAAQAQPEWASRMPSERAAVMQRAAAIMETRQAEIVSWLIQEAGSTRIKAQLEWQSVHAVMLEAAMAPFLVEGRILPADIPGKECRVYRKPVGVVGVISPWNWPLQLTSRSIAPALVVGNAVVIKPASDTPVTGGLLLARLVEEAGLPPGVLSVLVGAAREIGNAFVTHPIPRVISFTGSTPVGRNIAKLAADAPIMKRVNLELGGNGAFVVLEDADLDRALDAAVFGKFLHQGQICMITNRFIVEEGIYDSFLERFAERVRGLKTGNPDAPETLIGPLIDEKQLEGLMQRLARARGSGARQVVGGEPEGLVLPPHVFADVTDEMELAREELFGPVAPVIRARDEEDALRIANDTGFGLSSCVFTADLERGARFAQRL